MSVKQATSTGWNPSQGNIFQSGNEAFRPIISALAGMGPNKGAMGMKDVILMMQARKWMKSNPGPNITPTSIQAPKW